MKRWLVLDYYAKPDCPLCVKAQRTMAQAFARCAEIPIRVRPRNILDSPYWYRRYRTEIPVLAYRDRVLFRHWTTPLALERRIRTLWEAVRDDPTEEPQMAELRFETIVDLTYPVDEHAPREPAIGPPKIYHTATMEKDGYFESRVDLSGHCSTHIDTPSLMVPNGYTADGVALWRLVGTATKISLTHLQPGDVITAAVLDSWEQAGGSLPEGEMAFLYTGMQELFGQPIYNQKWVGLDGSGAQWLVDRGVKLVGTDACAIESIYGPRDDFPAHRTFLRNEVPIVENLCRLDAVPDRFWVVVAPMKLATSSGAPTRVLAFV